MKNYLKSGYVYFKENKKERWSLYSAIYMAPLLYGWALYILPLLMVDAANLDLPVTLAVMGFVFTSLWFAMIIIPHCLADLTFWVTRVKYD